MFGLIGLILFRTKQNSIFRAIEKEEEMFKDFNKNIIQIELTNSRESE